MCAGNYENQVTALNNQVIYFVNDVFKFGHNNDQFDNVSSVVACKLLVTRHGC